MLSSEQVKVLAELGFTALMRDMDEQALTIFKGVEAARPGQEAAAIGLAMLDLKKNNIDSAINHLKKFSANEQALTFLGLAYFRKGEVAKATKVLNDAISIAKDPQSCALALNILQAIEAEKGI